MSHFELIFVEGRRLEARGTDCIWKSNDSIGFGRKGNSFSAELPFPFISKLAVCVGLFLESHSLPLVWILLLEPIQSRLDYCSFRVKLRIRSCEASEVVGLFFFKIISARLFPLPFHINSTISPCMSAKFTLGICGSMWEISSLNHNWSSNRCTVFHLWRSLFLAPVFRNFACRPYTYVLDLLYVFYLGGILWLMMLFSHFLNFYILWIAMLLVFGY